MNIRTLHQLTANWFSDRGITQNSTGLKQSVKLLEEITELHEGLVNEDLKLIHDSIGDITVVLIGICEIEKVDFVDCWLRADSAPPITTAYAMAPMLSIFPHLLYALNEKPNNTQDSIVSYLATLKQLAVLEETTLEACLHLAYNEIKNRKGYLNENGVFIKDAGN